MKENELRVALAQIAPVWLNKQATLEKVQRTILQAAAKEAELVVFGEGVVPGYPFWLALTDGAAWDTKVNKELHAHYANQVAETMPQKTQPKTRQENRSHKKTEYENLFRIEA